MSNYSSISLPSELLKEIEKIITNKSLGYKSVAEFIKEAIRRYISLIYKETEIKNLIK